MRIQYTYVIEGDFQPIEYKNHIVHKVHLHNLERKSPQNPPVTGTVSAKTDTRIVCIMEGEEADLVSLRSEVERGPVIAHINKIDLQKNQYSGKYSGFKAKRHFH